MNGFIVLVSLLVLHTRVDCMTKNGTKTCSQLTSVIQNIPQTMILKNPTQANNLRICQSNLTCCSKQMENELYMKSSRVLKDAVHRQANATHHFLKTQASLFDGFFKNLLTTAKGKWHNLLLITYKDMYMRNRLIFDDFFSTLEMYYANGSIDLDKSFNLFFQRIQSTIIVLINKNFANKPGFLNCTSKNIDKIQPFGHYQQRISVRLKSSLAHARTFVVGLKTGSNVTASIINYFSRNECGEALTKIQHCSVCEGIPNAMVCNATCNNMLQSCFKIYPQMDAYWNEFIRGVYMLSTGLDGQYDIEAVFGQLGYDISSAIMEFQNNFLRVLTKAQTLCPIGSRKKRAVDETGSDLYLEGGRVRRNVLNSPTYSTVTERPPTLDTFTTAFRMKLAGIGNVWKDLPRKICGAQTFVSRDRNESCWNGIEMQRNTRNVPNVDVVIDDGHRQQIVQQLLNLKNIVKKPLVNPIIPTTTETPDEDDEESESGSGSSGSGSDEMSGSGEPTTTSVVTEETKTNHPSPSIMKTSRVISTPDPSVYTDDMVDSEGSGTTPYNKYTTTSKSGLTKNNTDDEDLVNQSGSGDRETTTDSTRDHNNPFTPTIIGISDVIRIKITPEKIIPAGSGSRSSVMPYILLLTVTIGLMIM